MIETNENKYPGQPGSDMAVACDERIYSFYKLPDLRAMVVGQTYAMQISPHPEFPDKVGFVFYESFLDLSDASWGEIVDQAQKYGDKLWAAVVVLNDLTPTGGVMVVESRNANNPNRVEFTYDNVAGTLDAKAAPPRL